MKILAVDSSAKIAAVAVCTEDKILAETTLDVGLTHSQTLMPVCAALLNNAHIDINEIDAFAAAAGPGSFTGLRIGISAVKGMALATGKPCYPVSTLEALACNLIGLDGLVCAVMDARRSQVYHALFALTDGGLTRLCDDCAISIEELAAELAGYSDKIWLCGDGAPLCWSRLSDKLPNIRLASPAFRYQKASGVAAAALRSGSAVTARQLTPRYLRLPQAERERKERLQQAEEKVTDCCK